MQCVHLVVFIYRFHCTSTTTVCPLGGLYIQVPLYINYYSVSLGWSLYTGSTVHQLLQCVPWVVFIYRFYCTSTTTVCPLGGLYIQVLLYINYYIVSLGWSSYTGYIVHQLLQCGPWVVLIYRFYCTSTTTVCPLCGLNIQVLLYINYYSVSLGWSLYTGSTVHQLLQCVPRVVLYTGSTVYKLLQCVPWVDFALNTVHTVHYTITVGSQIALITGSIQLFGLVGSQQKH